MGNLKKNSPPRYLNRDKRYGSRKNPCRHKKSTGEKISNTNGKSCTASAEACTVPIFFNEYIINQCICKKKLQNLAPVLISQISETVTRRPTGIRTFSNTCGAYCRYSGQIPTCRICDEREQIGKNCRTESTVLNPPVPKTTRVEKSSQQQTTVANSAKNTNETSPMWWK